MVKRTLAALSGSLLCLSLPAGAAPGKVSSDGFSYALPAGWQALDLKHAPKTLHSLASPAGDAAAAFSVQDVSSALPPDRYVQRLLTGLKAASPQTRVLSRGPFVTASGLRGFRAVFEEAAPGGDVHFVLCVFPGAGRRKLLAAGIWPSSENPAYAAAADASLSTVTRK